MPPARATPLALILPPSTSAPGASDATGKRESDRDTIRFSYEVDEDPASEADDPTPDQDGFLIYDVDPVRGRADYGRADYKKGVDADAN
jgi:hypothetical protein